MVLTLPPLSYTLLVCLVAAHSEILLDMHSKNQSPLPPKLEPKKTPLSLLHLEAILAGQQVGSDTGTKQTGVQFSQAARGKHVHILLLWHSAQAPRGKHVHILLHFAKAASGKHVHILLHSAKAAIGKHVHILLLRHFAKEVRGKHVHILLQGHSTLSYGTYTV